MNRDLSKRENVSEIQSGYQLYAERLNQELECRLGISLEECACDEEVYKWFLNQEPVEWIIDQIAMLNRTSA
jgi:hypothetical protein